VNLRLLFVELPATKPSVGDLGFDSTNYKFLKKLRVWGKNWKCCKEYERKTLEECYEEYEKKRVF